MRTSLNSRSPDADAIVEDASERVENPVEIHKPRDRSLDNASNVRVARATKGLNKMFRIVDRHK